MHMPQMRMLFFYKYLERSWMRSINTGIGNLE